MEIKDKITSYSNAKTEEELSVSVKSQHINDQVKLGNTSGIKSVTEKSSILPEKRKKNKKIMDFLIKPNKLKKVKTESNKIPDIEDVWQPENWREVLDNILTMRKFFYDEGPEKVLEDCEDSPILRIPPKVRQYHILINLMLSSQTRDEVTGAATMRLMKHGLTVDNIMNTPDEKIGELIRPVGFWKTKVKYIKNTTQILKDQYQGDIPKTFKELCKLPGIGPKMANLIMTAAWKDTVGIAVDTHVHRISNRLGWVPMPTKQPGQTRQALERWLPEEEWRLINITLVNFGQTVCKPVGPSCDFCLNKKLCPFVKSSLSSEPGNKS